MSIAIGLGALLALPASADSEIPPLSFAFAHYTGSGIYAVEGRSVQIYSIPASIPVRRRGEVPWGLNVTIVATLGFYDFKAADVLESGLPQNIGTASLIPGIRFDLLATDRWTVAPFAEAGAAKDFEGGKVVYVAGLGMDSQFRFPWKGLDGLVRNRLVFSRSTPSDSDERDTYAEMRSALEITGPLDFQVSGHGTELTGFVASYIFRRPPEVTATRLIGDSKEDLNLWLQWELGITIGPRPAAKVWKFDFPRFGISYRFGDGPSAIRIVFGNPF